MVKKFLKHHYILFTHNGKINTGIDVFQYIKKLADIGVGEILLNSIDNDGTMKGYDLKFAEMVREKCDVPLTILGGAGNYSHILELINKFNIIGVAAGSLFVFKGKYKAVLINYPDIETKLKMTNFSEQVN